MSEQFAKNLRRLRQEKGYTQERLAQKLGVGPQAVSRWECGNTLPDVMLLPRLAEAFGVTVDDLYREQAIAYPNYAQRLLAVYEASQRTEDFLAAEQEFLRLLSADPTADDLRAFGVLYHYMTASCAAKAQQYLESAMAKADRFDWVYRSAAQQKITLLCMLGRGAEEIQRYQTELAQDPSDSQRWLLSVAAYHLSGEDAQAYQLVKEALDRFPENAALHSYAGDICQALQCYDEAFAHWQRVKTLDSSFLDADYAMGFCHEALGQYPQALAIWRCLEQTLSRRGLSQECQLPAAHIRLCEARILSQ